MEFTGGLLIYNIMKYLLICLFCLIFSFSCKNKNEKEELSNRIERVNDCDSNSVKVVQGTEIAVETILHPNRMEIGNGMLFVSCFKRDTMIYTFSLPDMKFLNCFGQKGEGPEDLVGSIPGKTLFN